MTDNKIQEALKEILGSNAISNSDFKVSEEVGLLCRVVNYVDTQLSILEEQFITGDDKEYVWKIRKNIIEMLKPNHGK